MEQLRKFVKKRFVLQVTAPDQSYPKKFDLDKNIRTVRGICISSDKPDMLFYRGSQKMELSGLELFPEDWESRLLMSGISVAPDIKFADLGDEVLAGNGELKVWFKDTENPYAPFDTYEVRIYLMCELSE